MATGSVLTLTLAVLLTIATGCQPETPRPAAAAASSLGAMKSGVVTPRTAAQIVNVVDGDTAAVMVGSERIRLHLIGMDTPETVDPRKQVQCFGREASDHAKVLLNGQAVELEADPSQDERDDYGRLLRYVWLADGLMFNVVMIRDGYAHEYTYNRNPRPYKYQAEFKAAEAEARDAKRGLWAPETCNGNTEQPAVAGPAPPKPGTPMTGTASKQQARACPPDKPIKGNRPSMVYHVPGGGSYTRTNPEDCFATEQDAQAAGYRKALN